LPLQTVETDDAIGAHIIGQQDGQLLALPTASAQFQAVDIDDIDLRVPATPVTWACSVPVTPNRDATTSDRTVRCAPVSTMK
jgi:hypothetical protein